MKVTIIINKNLLVIDWITNHFGKNPKNGGSPPKDNRDKKSVNLVKGDSLNEENIWLKCERLNKAKKIMIVKDK